MAAVLKITDGSEEVNLIDEQAGFILKEWIPAIPTYKNGGVFADSPLVEGRRLVSKQFGNVTDTFRVDVREAGQDALIAQLQTLRQLLEKAANYWVTEWQTEPVWLEAQASCESNKRYAIIYMGSLPEDDNFYAQPFIGERGKAAMDDLSLVVEHGIWQDVEPGQEGNALEISSQSVAPDLKTYGQEASTAGAYIANKYTPDDQITHIYYYDDSLAAYSANLINAAVPFALTPNPTQANDIIYFGVEDPGGRYVNFTNIIFDIGTAAVNITGYAWEYYTGAAWAALSPSDLTVGFTATGIRVVSWNMPASFSSVAINGITAFWVRFRISAVGGAVTRPTQQNRYVYSQIVPYIDVDSSAVSGDISALVRYTIYSKTTTYFSRIIYGSRSLSRGVNFSAYLNASNHSNMPPDVDTSMGFTAKREAPSGICSYITAGAATWTTWSAWVIDYPSTQHYHGRFRVFLRGYQNNGSAGDVKVRIVFQYGNSVSSLLYTDIGTFLELTDGECVDLGQISLPPTGQSHLMTEQEIYVTLIYIKEASTNFYVYDLILMPIDESFGEVILKDNGAISSHLDFGHYYPNVNNYAVSKYSTTDYVDTYYQYITSHIPFIQSQSDQRIWFLVGYYYTNLSHPVRSVNGVVMQKYQRYLSARGDK